MNTNTTTTALLSVDDFMAATAAADKIKYPWERSLLAVLLAVGYVHSTRSGFAVLGGGATLKLWQVQRFLDAGLMTRRVEYDESNPQSMFDAPVTVDQYEPTDLGRRVARLAAEGGAR